jgi:hypothetical protein
VEVPFFFLEERCLEACLEERWGASDTAVQQTASEAHNVLSFGVAEMLQQGKKHGRFW